MFTAGGSTASSTVPTEERPEAPEKSVLDKAAEILAAWWADAYEKRLTARMENRRGYRPFDPGPQQEPDPERLRRLEGDLGRDYEREYGFRMGGYQEGGGNKWDKWAVPGLVTLAVSGIIGNVVQSMTVSALRQEVTDLKAQVERVEKLVEPRYRGG